jgi:arylformamidase
MISISSPIHRDEGRRAHRELLSRDDFLIIEDMDLMEKPREIRRLILAPLMVEIMDSSPCLVLAEI